MAARKRAPDKGGIAEEALRSYFYESGYFVARGVPFIFGDLDITDIDLWIYLRGSVLSRSRANVDAKNKNTPKAAERILWARGLQQALGLDEAIVATTSKNEAIRVFGEKHGVRVLDGHLLSSIIGKFSSDPTRIPEEEFQANLDESGIDKLQGNWLARIQISRSRLLTSLNFSGCNAWLSDTVGFLDAFAAGQRREAALRCAYLSVAYFLIGLDFSLMKFAFVPVDARREQLRMGFTYGEGGKERLEHLLDLLREMGESDAYGQLRSEHDREDSRAEMLAEYFSRNDIAGRAFGLARKFDTAAYLRITPCPGELEGDMKAIIGVILDAHRMNRRAILGLSNEGTAPT